MAGDIFREVDEAMREDRLKGLWQRFRFVIIGACAAVVVLVAAWEFYRRHHDETARERAARWQEILALPQSEQSEAIVEFTAARRDGYSDFANLYQARAQIESGSDDEAIAALNRLIADAEPIYAALARIEKAVIFLDEQAYDEAARTLEPLLEDDRPFRALALYYAALAALSQSNYATAEALTVTLLALGDAPAQIQALAKELQAQAKTLKP